MSTQITGSASILQCCPRIATRTQLCRRYALGGEHHSVFRAYRVHLTGHFSMGLDSGVIQSLAVYVHDRILVSLPEIARNRPAIVTVTDWVRCHAARELPAAPSRRARMHW